MASTKKMQERARAKKALRKEIKRQVHAFVRQSAAKMGYTRVDMSDSESFIDAVTNARFKHAPGPDLFDALTNAFVAEAQRTSGDESAVAMRNLLESRRQALLAGIS